MKAKFLNPFVKSTFDVIQAMLGEAPKKGNVYIRRGMSNGADDITISLGVSGGIAGNVSITGARECMIRIAARMLMEETLPVFDDMAASALGELGNMIVAGASVGLADGGCITDITPPIVISGGELTMSCPPNFNTIVIPLEIESLGSLNINLSLVERATEESTAFAAMVS